MLRADPDGDYDNDVEYYDLSEGVEVEEIIEYDGEILEVHQYTNTQDLNHGGFKSLPNVNQRRMG